MECKTELANYTCQLPDPIDAICSDAHFNNVAIIQRCKKEASKIVSYQQKKLYSEILSGSTVMVSILEVKHDKLKILHSMSSKPGKISQAFPCSIAWSPIDGEIVKFKSILLNIFLQILR